MQSLRVINSKAQLRNGMQIVPNWPGADPNGLFEVIKVDTPAKNNGETMHVKCLRGNQWSVGKEFPADTFRPAKWAVMSSTPDDPDGL